VPRRLLASIVFTFALAAVATTATASAMPVQASAPLVVHRGQAVKVTITTKASFKGVCVAAALYADGSRQDSGIKRPSGGRVTWTIRIPNTVPFGRATWTVRCGVTFQRSGSWLVKPVSGTQPDTTPHVIVDKQGFTQRPDKYGTGSSVSYGLLLKNTSMTQDATNVYLLINFATAGGQLIGTVTKSLALIPAGGTIAMGDAMQMRTQAAVTNLEVTIRVVAHEPAKPRILPHFVNVAILQSPSDTGYVGEVDGEIVNDTSPQTLTMAKLSIVLLDANGRIVGGGTGMSFSPLPTGSRMVFLAQTGFTAVPISQAVTYVISVEPTYQSD
jgi:hypothetical protein